MLYAVELFIHSFIINTGKKFWNVEVTKTCIRDRLSLPLA